MLVNLTCGFAVFKNILLLDIRLASRQKDPSAKNVKIRTILLPKYSMAKKPLM